MQHGSPINSLAQKDINPYDSLLNQNIVVIATIIPTRIITIFGYDYVNWIPTQTITTNIISLYLINTLVS
jgi:hypothetical protein